MQAVGSGGVKSEMEWSGVGRGCLGEVAWCRYGASAGGQEGGGGGPSPYLYVAHPQGCGCGFSCG